jgi:hypothetical protein
MMVPSRVYAESEALLKSDQPLLIKAAVSIDRGDGDTNTLRARCVEVRSLAETRSEAAQRVEIHLPEDAVEPVRLKRLRETFREFPGRCKVTMRVAVGGLGAKPAGPRPDQETCARAEVTLEMPEPLRLAASDSVVDRIEAIFGRGVVHFV